MPLSWDIAFPDGKHELTLAHNSLSGNRLVKFDGKVVFNSGWMFKLVGPSKFTIKHSGKEHPCVIHIRPVGMQYAYELTVDGKSLTRHQETMRLVSRTWTVTLDGVEHIIVLEKDKMNVCVDGASVDVEDTFVDDGTETLFKIGSHDCCIHTTRRGDNDKLEQVLYVEDEEIPEKFENRLLF
eukprot:m.65020 g.65020  ORF g.65020 m.65020 type:complete len:182 (+) comp8260_c0_seq2:283-828(+)